MAVGKKSAMFPWHHHLRRMPMVYMGIGHADLLEIRIGACGS